MEAITHEEYVKALHIVQTYREQQDAPFLNLVEETSRRVGHVIEDFFRNEYDLEINPYKIKITDVMKIDMNKIGKYRNFGKYSRLQLASFMEKFNKKLTLEISK
jgi:hypothetical protein